MKKILCILLCGALLCAAVLPVFANSVPEQRETLEDGSYFVTVVNDDSPHYGEIAADTGLTAVINRLIRFLRQMIQLLGGIKTVSKTKYVNYYDSNGTLLWTVSLTAEFTYNKQQATCTSVSRHYVVYDRDWSVVSARTEKEGNTATGWFTVRQTKLGVPLKTIERTLILTCDANGNVT